MQTSRRPGAAQVTPRSEACRPATPCPPGPPGSTHPDPDPPGRTAAPREDFSALAAKPRCRHGTRNLPIVSAVIADFPPQLFILKNFTSTSKSMKQCPVSHLRPVSLPRARAPSGGRGPVGSQTETQHFTFMVRPWQATSKEMETLL